jgi:hypothetical protein
MRYDFSSCVLFLVLTIETIKFHIKFLFFLFLIQLLNFIISVHSYNFVMHAWLPGISKKAPKIYNFVSNSKSQANHFPPKITHILTHKFPNKKHSSVKIKSLIKTHIIQFSNEKIKNFNRENLNVKYEKKRGKMKTIIVLRKTLLKI